MIPTLIHCAAGNKRFADIALAAGFRYGAQLPNTTYCPPYFVDLDPNKFPDKVRYIGAIKALDQAPSLITTPDIDELDQIPRALEWAEEVAALQPERVLIITRGVGIAQHIPEIIGGVKIRLAYSVPTTHGGAVAFLWEFGQREVHLLGGSPNEQMKLRRYLNVASADGNYLQKVALIGAMVWHTKKPHWRTLSSVIGHVETDAPYRAFEISTKNYMEAWNDL